MFDAGALDAFDIAGWARVNPAHADSIAERIDEFAEARERFGANVDGLES